MATITADRPADDKVTTAAEPTRPGLWHEESRQLWQTPVFLTGVGVLVFVLLNRPFGGDPAIRQLDREMATARQLLARSDGDPKVAAEHARRALEGTAAFPDRRGEALFLLASAEMRQAERAPAAEVADLWLGARRDFEDAERLGVPEADRGRLQYRLALTLFHTGEAPQRVVDRLKTAVDMADDRAEGYRLLTEAYLRLPPTPGNLESALAANEKLRMVFPIAPELQARAQLQAGELSLRLNKSEAARKILEKIGPQAPPGILTQAHVLRARSFQNDSRWQEAADLWKALLADTQNPLPERGPALYNVGVCLARLNQSPDATAPYWEECLKVAKGPEAAAAALELAQVLMQGPTPDKAISPLTRAVEAVTDPAVKNPLVDVKQVRERCEQGVQKYREKARFDLALQVLDLYQHLAVPGRAAWLRGEVCADWAKARQKAAAQMPPGEGRDNEQDAARRLAAAAAGAYLRAGDEGPPETREDAVWLAAICRCDSGDYRAAIQALTLYLQAGTKPERVNEAWFRLGECHRLGSEPAARVVAEEAYRKCIQGRSSFSCRASYQLALCYIADGRFDDASAELVRNVDRLRKYENDPEILEKSLIALGGLAFQRNDYREVVNRLEMVLSVDHPPTNAEGTRARFQLAESYRQLADQEEKTLLEGPKRSAEEKELLQKEKKKWLTKAAEEYLELARFLDTPESNGQLSPEERVSVPFLAAICRFNGGEYETALEIYSLLVTRFAAPVPPAQRKLEPRWPQFRLEALAGVIRCHAALDHRGEVRKQLEELRAALQQADPAVRADYDAWIRQAEKSLTAP